MKTSDQKKEFAHLGKNLNITGKVAMGGINISAKVKSIEILDDRIIIHTDRQKEGKTEEELYALNSKGEKVPSNARIRIIDPS